MPRGENLMWDKCFTGASAPKELAPVLDIAALAD